MTSGGYGQQEQEAKAPASTPAVKQHLVAIRGTAASCKFGCLNSILGVTGRFAEKGFRKHKITLSMFGNPGCLTHGLIFTAKRRAALTGVLFTSDRCFIVPANKLQLVLVGINSDIQLSDFTFCFTLLSEKHQMWQKSEILKKKSCLFLA